MTDLIDRLAGDSQYMTPSRDSISIHEFSAGYRMYALDGYTRGQLATHFDIVDTDEVRQATQIADKIDSSLGIFALPINVGNVTWTNMPTAETEIFGNTYRRLIYNPSLYTHIRLVARLGTAGFSGSTIYLQYSTDGNTWVTLGNSVSLTTGNTTVITAWATIPVEAKASDVHLRMMGSNGNGVIDPIIGTIYAHLSVPAEKLNYLTRLDAVMLAMGTDNSIYRSGGVLNKALIYSHLGIAG